MRAFKDTTGREWRIKLTLGAVDRVAELHGVDLLDPFGVDEAGRPLVTRLRTDLRLLGNVIGEIVETTADRQLTADELRDAFDGATKAAAWQAFSEEWADFFRQDGRPDVATAIARHEEMIAAAVKQATAQIEAIDPTEAISAAQRLTS